jgi:hypothetical protein
MTHRGTYVSQPFFYQSPFTSWPALRDRIFNISGSSPPKRYGEKGIVEGFGHKEFNDALRNAR